MEDVLRLGAGPFGGTCWLDQDGVVAPTTEGAYREMAKRRGWALDDEILRGARSIDQAAGRRYEP